MAVFGKIRTNKLCLDDTSPLKCTIDKSYDRNGHTEYSIKVQRGCDSWFVAHRYSEFSALNSFLQSANIRVPFPPKKILGNTNAEFVAERRHELQIYLDTLVNDVIVSNSLQLKMFLDPNNYSTLLNESALQNVSMALRGDGNYCLVDKLGSIGWRIRKHYYIVSKDKTSNGNYMMTWQTYGPDRHLSERDMKAVFRSLTSLEHPFIDKLLFIHNLETGTYVIKNIHPNGTIKDYLYGTDYKTSYLHKYGNPKQRKPFTTREIAHYGSQILQGLNFLHLKGLPYGHLHTGNIAIENQRIVLMDIENSIIGVPTKFRQYIVKHKRISSIKDIDVYCFGHVLYEMAFAEILYDSTCNLIPPHESDDLCTIIATILTSAAVKHDLPQIDVLMSHSFFKSEFYNGESRAGYLKFALPIKDQLKSITDRIEVRLKTDQKAYYIEKKQLRIQEILNSEEEISKRKHKSKDKIFRSSSLDRLSPNLTSPTERSISVASSSSTASSHTLPLMNETNSSQLAIPSSTNDRSSLLNSICSFNKSALNKVQQLK